MRGDIGGRRFAQRRGAEGRERGSESSVIGVVRWTLAEGEGFEPSRGLVTPYSLSRRAPSATRSSLRVHQLTGGLPRPTRGSGALAARHVGVEPLQRLGHRALGLLGPARERSMYMRVPRMAVDQSYVSRTRCRRRRARASYRHGAPPKCRQAMRRLSSNSITVFVIAYGMPSRIDMPNFVPSSSRAGSCPRVASPCRSRRSPGCRAGSARRREDPLRERRDHPLDGDDVRIIGHGSQGTVTAWTRSRRWSASPTCSS